ncbi:MAG TPA: NAD(P)/FAD-dependent oxidoreductase [Vicinamibacterales bacterium]|jgi:geranylgeranyl reductase family protein
MSRFDVAVVGAGPAGSLAAAMLARRGARVALIDGSHPREKPCGGGITGRALDLVASHAGVDTPGGVRIRTARFVDAVTGASASVGFAATGRPRLVVASRTVFDELLYRQAAQTGATILRTRAVDVRREPGGLAITAADGRSIAAGWLIGADGANSLVRRRLAHPFSRADLSIATGFYAHGVTSQEVVIEITEDPPGYIWSFPRPDHLAIGICSQADRPETAASLRRRVESWIHRTAIARGATLERYSWPIPSLAAASLETLSVAGDRWLTIGDAAGLVDPITREGIYFALQSARFAAEALVGAGDAARDYARHVRAAIVAELLRAARFKAGFFQPRFTRLLIEALQHSAPIRSVMADLVAGEQSYADLKWRLIKTLELKLAWRVFTATDSRRGHEHGRLAG